MGGSQIPGGPRCDVNRSRVALASIVLASLACNALVAGPANASTPGVSSNSITIGLITSLTGEAAPEYTGVVPSAEARIDLQNARGGIDGRKIHLIVEDDATNPTTNATDSQLLVSKGVFGVIDESPLVFGGYKVLQEAGIPVTGGAFDGPEWGQQPNTNMFSISGSLDPHNPASTLIPEFIKTHGERSFPPLDIPSRPRRSKRPPGSCTPHKRSG